MRDVSSVTEAFVDNDGVRLWTASQGVGHPVMLCNGGAGCCDYLGPVAAMIDDLAKVIRFEQRGCGRSDPTPPYDVKTCVLDLDRIRAHYGVERWIVGGHSWGSDLALAYALAHPARVSGLLCIAGGKVHDDRDWHETYDRRMREQGERLPHFAYPPNMEVNEQINRSWKRYIIKSPHLLKDISELMMPALFVYGEEDIRPRWPTEQLAHLMPNSRFELIDGAEHVIWFSHPNELKSILRNFVDDIIRKGKRVN